MKQIIASCCSLGGLTEEVYAKLEDCPIRREDGQRKVALKEGGYRAEVTCMSRSAFKCMESSVCQHYRGCKKRKYEYVISCNG